MKWAISVAAATGLMCAACNLDASTEMEIREDLLDEGFTEHQVEAANRVGLAMAKVKICGANSERPDDLNRTIKRESVAASLAGDVLTKRADRFARFHVTKERAKSLLCKEG